MVSIRARATESSAGHVWKWTAYLALLAGLLLIPRPVSAKALAQQFDITQQCFAVADEDITDNRSDTLVRLNRTTGETSAIGPTGTDSIEAIVFNSNRELLGANHEQLGTLNLTTGEFISTTQPFGVATGVSGNINLRDVDSLAYDIKEDRYYGVHRRNNDNADLLFVFDPVTGAHIPNFFASGISYIPIEILTDSANLPLDDVDDLAIDPVNGDMYVAINNGGTGGILGLLDPTTGGVTEIGEFRYPNPNPKNPALAGKVIDDIEGLAFLNDGQLYASTGEHGPDDNDSNKLFQIDKTTAEGIEVGAFPAEFRDYEGLDCLSFQAFIVLEKFTNGPGQEPQDADTPPGPSIVAGDTVTWTYILTNTAVFTLTDLVLTDDQIGQIGPNGAANCPPAGTLLGPGESLTCTVSGTAQEGQYANTAIVTGTTQVGLVRPRQTVTATDPSHYTGLPPTNVVPGVDIEKATNGEDADSPPGPQLVEGDAVAWTYVVVNTGNVTLVDVTVTDDQGVTVSCPATELAPGANMTCTANGTAQLGQYANIGTVVGTPTQGSVNQVTDSDPSHYFGVPAGGPAPAVDIEKATNGEDADTPIGPVLGVGDTVTWTFTVQNTGNVTLVEVTVTDDKLGPICVIPTLAPGEIDTCEATGTAAEGQYANTGFVTATPETGPSDPVTDSDPSHYFGVPPGGPTEPGSIGDFVWFDDNKDGIQDADEEGVPGIAVRLFLNNFDAAPIATTTTNDAGRYSFSDLGAGSYCLEFTLPEDFVASPADQGDDDSIDSDGVTTLDSDDASVVRTVCFPLAENSIDLTRDLGIYEDTTPTGEDPIDQPSAGMQHLYLPNLNR